MAIFKKTILAPGAYSAPQGMLHATNARLRGWVDKFRAMRAAGVRVPVCWGHQPGAIPGDGQDKAHRQFALSRFNAGYVRDMAISPDGEIDAELDIPGAEVDEDGNLVTWAKLPDGRKVRCAIKEVSAAIRDWKDGRGKEWPDAIVHIALVPLPVMAGQDGFEAVEPRGSAAGSPDGAEWHLSLSDHLYTLSTDEGDTMPDTMTTPDVAGGSKLAQCIDILKQFGLPLPADTNDANLCERICLIGDAFVQAGVIGGGMEMADEPDGDEMMDGDLDDQGDLMDEGMDDLPPADDEEPDMADDLDPDEGIEVSGDSDGMPGDMDEDEDEEDEEGATEEPRPMMLGTKPGKGGMVFRTKLERTLAQQVAKDVQTRRLDRIAKLERRGALPRHRAEQFRAAVKASPPQLARKGDRIIAVEQRVDVELSTIEGLASSGGMVLRGGSRKGRRASRPEVEARQDTPAIRKLIEESANRHSVHRNGRNSGN